MNCLLWRIEDWHVETEGNAVEMLVGLSDACCVRFHNLPTEHSLEFLCSGVDQNTGRSLWARLWPEFS